MFSDYKGIKLEIAISRKSPIIWKLNPLLTIINDSKKVSQRKLENKNINICGMQLKQSLEGNLLYVHRLEKIEKSKINDLRFPFHLKKL